MKGLTKRVTLYFLPGIVPTVLLTLFYFVGFNNVPSILVLIVVDLLVIVPLMLYMMAKDLGVSWGYRAIEKIFRQQQCLKFWPFAGLVVFSLTWAIAIFQFMKPISDFLMDTLFSWLPSWFELNNYVTQKPLYDQAILKITLFLVFLASILIPLAEEIYFRGFLLLNKEQSEKKPVLVNTILFSAYHLWSPWHLLTRAIATYPIHYFVWRKKNIFLSVVTHCILNLVGDVILIYPLLFNT